MPHLREQQAGLVAALRPDARANAQRWAEAHLVHRPPLSARRRLAIYRHSISSTQIRALESTFPVLQKILGAAAFSRLARDYAWTVGAPESDLNSLGHRLDRWIDSGQRGLSKFSALPYLADLVRLEWAWHRAHLAADAPVFAFAAFSQALQAGHSVRLRPNAALTLIHSQYPILRIWRAYRGQQALGPVRVHPRVIVVCRQADSQVQVLGMAADTASNALIALVAGESLQSAGDRYSELPWDQLLPDWIGCGWLVGFESLEAAGV